MELPVLYKKSSKGKLQQWKIWTEHNLIVTAHGYIDGKLTTDKPTECKGKNLGRANETSPCKQAELQAESKWKKQLDKGYKDSIEKVENELVILPMLAQSFDKRKHDISYPCYVQPKYDGIRCLAMLKDGEVHLMSRKGKPFPHLQHLRNEMKEILEEGIVLDGELYSDDLSFQEITGIVRRETLKEGHTEMIDKICIRVYDMINLNNLDMDFIDRHNYIEKIVVPHDVYPQNKVRRVPTYEINSEEEVYKYHDKFVQEGYEGCMARNAKGAYGINKRSKDLQKYKHFMDSEYRIVGYCEGQGNEIGTVIWECVTDKGQKFRVRPKGTREERQEWFSNGDKYLNEMLTVRFQELTTDGIPRFPVGIAIRSYE